MMRRWWSQTGSNRRPHACKARALPTELWPREIVVRVKPALSLEPVVGLGGLEPPTSRLSSARSNQLSYKPSRPRKVLKTPRPKPTLNPRRLRPLLASKRKVPCVQNERETKTAGPANAARLKPLIFRARSYQRKTVRLYAAETKASARLNAEFQKGGDPAAGSPTATLLRLRPSR